MVAPRHPIAVQGPTVATNLYAWVTWDRSDRSATSYRVYRDGVQLAVVAVTGDTWDKCAYRDATVSAGVAYHYHVVAVGPSGEARSPGCRIFVRSDAQIGATVDVDAQAGPTDREKIAQALLAAKNAGGGIAVLGNSTYTLGDLTAVGDILASAPKNVVLRGHASGGSKITTTDTGDATNAANTERLLRFASTPTTLSAVLTRKINVGDRTAWFDDVSWAIVGRKVQIDQSLSNGIGSIATAAGVTMDPGTPRDNGRSSDCVEIVAIDHAQKAVTFRYPFAAEFVIDTGELAGRALPTIKRYNDHGGCGVENVTFEGHADLATDPALFLMHVLVDKLPDFFFAECTFERASKHFVYLQDTGYTTFVGCAFGEQGAAADKTSGASAVYGINVARGPNCRVVDCDFGVGYNPVEATVLTADKNDGNLASYTTASVSPAANALILLVVDRDDDTLAQAPTVSGGGMSSWTLEETNAYDVAGGVRSELRVYRAMSATPGSGAITIDFAADAQSGCSWSVIQVTGVDTGGTNGSAAVVQSIVAAATSTGITANMGGFARRSHATLLAVAHQFNEATSAESLSWTELSDTSYVNPGKGLATYFRADNDATPSATWTTSALAGAIGIELRAHTTAVNRRSHFVMNEGAHRTVVRHCRFYDTALYNINTHGLGVEQFLVENCYFEPTPYCQRGALFLGNSSWGLDHGGVVRNCRCVSGPRFVSSQENTYEVRLIANVTSGLAANGDVATPCFAEWYGWDGPDTPPELTGSMRWTIRENVDTGLASNHVRLEQLHSSTYPTDSGSGSWARDLIHAGNSWNDTTSIVKPANTERIPYDTAGGDPPWANESFPWELSEDYQPEPEPQARRALLAVRPG